MFRGKKLNLPHHSTPIHPKSSSMAAWLSPGTWEYRRQPCTRSSGCQDRPSFWMAFLLQWNTGGLRFQNRRPQISVEIWNKNVQSNKEETLVYVCRDLEQIFQINLEINWKRNMTCWSYKNWNFFGIEFSKKSPVYWFGKLLKRGSLLW